MRFGSVCSGIEAASVAWEPLGWRADWFAEIEKFPSAVLAHHWPDVPNLGDMTALPNAVANDNIAAPDVLVGGTPCQAFSVAGMRQSLDDARGQLTLSFVRLADEIDRRRAAAGHGPAVVVWENVPGVLSTKDNAFGCFLAGLAGEDHPLFPAGPRWSNAGAVFGPARAVAWRILDAQYFGVAQRRRRVFVVASARDGFDPAAVLFEFDGVRRDTAPRRETGQGAAGNAGGGAAGSCFWNGEQLTQTLDAVLHKGQTMPEKNRFPAVLQARNDNAPGVFDVKGGLAPHGRADLSPVAHPLTASAHKDPQVVCASGNNAPQAAAFAENTRGEVRLEGGDGSRTGALSTGGGKAGQGVPMAVIPFDTTQITSPGNYSSPKPGDAMHPLAAGAHPPAVAVAVGGDIAHTLKGEGFDGSEDGTGRGVPTIAFSSKDYGADAQHDLAPTLRAGGHSESHANAGVPPAVTVGTPMAVRRLTPRECERLQGFPDDHTLVPVRGKPAADGPRYKALGNSMAVPVMRWIGARIQQHLQAQAQNDNTKGDTTE